MKQRLFVIVVLVVALAIRLISLNQSLWLDEGIEWWAVKTFSLHQLLFGYMNGDFNPPAHHLLMWFWVRFVGDSEFVLRFPSVLFGVGSVWCTYKIASILEGKEDKKLENWPFGVSGIAIILAAFSGLLVYYSQEARMYSMAAFFVASAMYTFLKYRQAPSYLLFTVYCVLFTVALYTHYLTWFLLPVVFLYGIQFTLPLLFTLPWWPELFKQLQAGISTAQNPVWASLSSVSIKNIGLLFVKFVTGRIPFPTSLSFRIPTMLFISLFWIVVWLGAKKLWVDTVTAKSNGRIIIYWGLAPLIIGGLVGVFVPIFSYFRFLFILPAVIVLASFGLARRTVWFGPIVAFLLLCTVIYTSGQANNREDWKGLAKELHFHESTPTVLLYPAVRPPFDYYDRGVSNVMDASSSQAMWAGHASLWFISYAEAIFGSGAGVEETLSENKYSRTFIRHFRGVTLQHWEKNREQ